MTQQIIPSEEIKVWIIGRDDKKEAGVVRLKQWNKKERKMRALKTLGLGWLAMLAVVFIPLLHFILVPALFLGSPIVASIIYNQERVILGGEGVCPECSTAFKIEKGSETWPLQDVCGNCHAHVTLEKQNSVGKDPRNV